MFYRLITQNQKLLASGLYLITVSIPLITKTNVPNYINYIYLIQKLNLMCFFNTKLRLILVTFVFIAYHLEVKNTIENYLCFLKIPSTLQHNLDG